MERETRMVRALTSRWTLSDVGYLTFRKDAHG